MPWWLATLLVLAAAGAGGWFVWRVAFRHETPAARAIPRSPIGDGIRRSQNYAKWGDSEVLIRGAMLWVFYRLQDVERAGLLMAQSRSDLANHVGLKKPQANELMKLEYDVPITSAERKKLQSLLGTYAAAFRDEEASADAADALHLALQDITTAHREQAEIASRQRIEKIQSILEPAQIEKAKAWLAEQMPKVEWLPVAPPPPIARPLFQFPALAPPPATRPSTRPSRGVGE
jgi:hypothetical protein